MNYNRVSVIERGGPRVENPLEGLRVKATKVDSKQVTSETGTGATEWISPPIDLGSIEGYYNAYHNRCIAVKIATTIGRGFADPLEAAKWPKSSDYKTFPQTMGQLGQNFYRLGNAAAELVFNAGGMIEAINWLPFSTLKINRDKMSVQQDVGGSKKKPTWPIFRGEATPGKPCVALIMNPGTWSTYYGEPDWLGCLHKILLADSADRHNRAKFDNNNVFDQIILINDVEGISDEKQDDEEGNAQPSTLEEFTQWMNDNFKGPQNRGKAAVLVGGDNGAIHQIKLASEDKEGEYLKLSEASRDAIVTAHGVAPRLANIVTAGQLGGGSEAREQLIIYRETTAIPYQKTIWVPFLERIAPFVQGANQVIELAQIDIEALAPLPTTTPAETLALQETNRMLKNAQR